MNTILKNGWCYDSDLSRFVKTDVLILENGMIGEVSDHISEQGCTVRDCSGMYMIPGLIDVHTHGRNCVDFNRLTDDRCTRIRREYAKTGTTTIMATLASALPDSLKESARIINKNRKPSGGTATIAGIHLEGRYIDPEKKGAHREDYLKKPDADELRELLNAFGKLPIHISAAFDLDTDGTFLETALRYGATCALAHSSAGFERSEELVDKGVTAFTHTFNAMMPLHHRHPGNAAASLLSDNAYSEFICDGIHLHPAIVRMSYRLKPHDRFVLITDSIEAAGAPEGVYSIAGMTVTYMNGVAKTETGAIAGSTLDLIDGMKNLMKFAGISLEEALPCATSNPAKMVGIYGDCGSIEPGKRADVVVLDGYSDFRIDTVLCSGEAADIK